MIKRIVLLISLLFAFNVSASESLVLQLKWEHEFQFAGFYAAKWQGYYQDAGLDVEIRSGVTPDKHLLDPVEEVLAGRADVGIDGVDLLLAWERGEKVAVLAGIFQQSPISLFTLNNKPLAIPADIRGKRVAIGLRPSIQAEITTLLRRNNIRIDEVNFVDVPSTLQSLLDGSADIIAGYAPSVRIDAQQKGLILNELDPKDFKVQFYGDTLFTSQALAEQQPELLEKFIQASLKGWRYALQNKEEVALRIASEMPRYMVQHENLRQYNQQFAEQIDQYIQYPQIPLGQVDPIRWLDINYAMRQAGLVSSELDVRSFLSPRLLDESRQEPTILLMVTTLVVFIPVILFCWYRRKLNFTILLLVAMVLAVDLLIEHILTEEIQSDAEVSTYRQLNNIASKLEAHLSLSISLLDSFSAYISANPDLSKDAFDRYAREMFKRENLLINFAAARDLVVNYVYPLAGNEEVLGLDYNRNDKQRAMVMRVAKSGETMVIGPVHLVQGGEAFITRAPVFVEQANGNRELWGIISAPLDTDALYRRSGISRSNGLRMAIRNFDALGGYGQAFYGDDAVFLQNDKIQLSIGVGGGTWQLAALPHPDVLALQRNTLAVRTIALLAAMGMVALIMFRFRQQREKQQFEKAILDSQHLLEKVGSVAQIGGWKVDEQLNVLQWSEQTNLVFNLPARYQPQQLDDLSRFIPPQSLEQIQQQLQQLFVNHQPFDTEVEIRQPEADSIWLRVMAEYSAEPNALAVGIAQDITEKVRSTQVIEHQATYDTLTGLPNRLLFSDRLKKALENAQRQQTQIGVLFIDLDRFKPVNDNHGHAVGDLLLQHIAARLKNCVRESDTVARLSGDEFGMVLSNVHNNLDILGIVEKIIEVVQQPVQIRDISINCSCSVGVAIYPQDGPDEQTLIIHADQAMYEVKSAGRNGWQFYTRELQEKSEHRHALLHDLINALSGNELQCFYQPIWNLHTHQIERCEALARWIRPDGRFVSPAEFIPIAEETGLVNKIDLRMMELAGRDLTGMTIGEQKIGLSINVSPRLFNSKDHALELWLNEVQQLAHKVDITVEITERLITDNTQKALGVLTQLKQMGVKIAIDDFGTGYSSLGYLVRFPVDIIKIDREFVSRIGQDASAEALIETILMMANRLNMTTVAEGIETEAQRLFLARLGCHFGQGFLLAKPMPLQDFEQLLCQDLHN